MSKSQQRVLSASLKNPKPGPPGDFRGIYEAGAAELASAQGINKIARALRLDYYSLKKRLRTVNRCRLK